MFTHINVEKDKAMILDRFKKSLTMFNYSDESIFFNIINYLGCYISALFKPNFSATDCCNTVESIEHIFSMTNNSEKYIEKDVRVSADEFKKISNMVGNIFILIKTMPTNLPFHTFVMIKYRGSWFLLQSFYGICGLFVIKDVNVAILMYDFIKEPTAEKFNHLFGTKLQEPITKIDTANIIISYKKFERLPLEFLKQLVQIFINENDEHF